MTLRYLLYLAKTLGCSRVKCRMAAQSISFFFRHVLKLPYVVPSLIYPRTASKLPPVMSPQEIKTLIDSIKNVKHRTVVMLLYSTGMRLSEIAALKITDIDSKNMRIKVVQGKGRPISHRSIQHLVQKALAQAGLNSKNYTVHTIRHSFATHLVDHGTDLHTVKELLGHSTLQTTMRYMHLTTTRRQGIINPYDALPQGKQTDDNSIKKIK